MDKALLLFAMIIEVLVYNSLYIIGSVLFIVTLTYCRPYKLLRHYKISINQYYITKF